MNTRTTSRVAALESRKAARLSLPWLRLLWLRGEMEPEVPEGHSAVIRRIVTPGDPPQWLARRPGEA